MSDKDYKKSSEIKGLVFCIISHAILFNKFDDLYDQAMLKFQQDEKSRVFCPCSDCSEALESLERILPQINTSMFKKAQKIVLEAYRKNCNFSLADEEGDNSVDLDMLLKESYEDGVPALVKDILLLQRLTAFKFVHSSVHGTDDFWESFIHQWEAVMQNLNVNDVVEETINYGPSYNQLSKNGLPIAGAYSGYFRGGPYDGTMIADGAGILESVRGTKEGKIKFKFSEASYALVLPEDIDVLTILSFCYEKHIFPSIDVPVALNLNTRFLREKRLEPQWLINTELGRTLYTTDVWAGEMAWGIDGFEMSSSQPSSLEAFQKIKKSLVGLGGLHVDLYPVINVNPKDFKRTKAAPFVGDEISIQVNAVKVGIDGGYTGKGRGWKHRNSKLYNHTRKTALLTESFNDIAVAFPVYERLRQLMATSYALRSLRKSGFMICPEDMDQLQERKKEFEMRFEVNPSPKYCTYLPISLTPKGFK